MEPVINLFTTTSEKTKAQINAFNSWKLLDNVIVRVFCDDSHMKPFFDEYGFEIISEFKTDEYDMPLVSSMYQIAYDICQEGEYYGYLNSDIIMLSDFTETFKAVSSIYSNFMLIGQRYDWPWEKSKIVDIKNTDWDSIIEECTLHNPGGLDYFIYSKEFFNVKEIPPFTIARGRFDHWLAGYGLEKTEFPVIDTTLTNRIIHFEPQHRITGEYNVPPEQVTNRTIQIKRNNMYFYNERLHGQTTSTPYYTTYNPNITIEKRRNPIPNEFGVIFRE